MSGSFVIVPSCAESLLDTSNFSSVNGTAVSSASPIVLSLFGVEVSSSAADNDDGGESLENLFSASSSEILNRRTGPS